MTRYVFLGIGTFLAFLFLVKMVQGRKFDSLVKNLDGGDFPLHQLYGVGLSWSQGLFKLKGKRAIDMRQQAALLYSQKFADYYANMYWAGAITLAHFFLFMTFLLAGLFYAMAPGIIAMGVLMGAYMVFYMMTNMKEKIESRKDECEAQLADVVSSLAILLNSGMVLREAWAMVGNSGEGALYHLIKQANDNIMSGYSEQDAYFEFAKLTNSPDIRKFTSAMVQNMEKGGGELVYYLTTQASELWHYKRQKLLQNGEKAATKLLMPIMLIFVGILIIILASAFGGSMI